MRLQKPALASKCVNAFDPSEVGNSGRFLETWNTSAIFSLTQTSGRLFNFTGWDMGWYNNNTRNASWNIRAYDANGNQMGSQDAYVGIGNVAFN